MAKKSSQYWARRKADEEAWIKQNIKNDTDFDKIIQKHYDELVRNINKEISDQYIRFAGREGMSIADAYKAVSQHDVQEFSDKAKEAVKHARDIFKKKGSVAYSDFDSELNRRLRLYNATIRINRLEYLKANLGLDLMNTNIEIGAELAERLKNGYTAEARRQAGILGETMGHTNIKDASKIVMAQTKNADFSERLWGNSDVLKSKLDGILTQQYIQGINPKVIASKLRPILADNVKNARYVTERLARTESARVAATAQLESFKKYGYKYVKWIAEPSACKICASIASSNEGVYSLKEVPYLPAHANCRCSISAWVEGIDTNEEKSKGIDDDIRQAMNNIDMNKANSQELINLGKKFNDNYHIDQLIGKKDELKMVFDRYRDMGGKVPDGTWFTRSNKTIRSQLQNAFSYYPKQWSRYLVDSNKKLFAGKTARGFFSSQIVTSSGIRYIKGALPNEGMSIYANGTRSTTPFHEIGHMIDYLNPNLVRIEQDWIRKRTEGESLTRLRDLFPGWGYNSSEVTKKDNFISPYIGKDYGRGSSEVLSVGLESIFEPQEGHVQSVSNGRMIYKKITDDPEYLNLIIGLILKG